MIELKNFKFVNFKSTVTLPKKCVMSYMFLCTMKERNHPNLKLKFKTSINIIQVSTNKNYKQFKINYNKIIIKMHITNN